MKKLYPYIFPAIALLLVLFLAFRWYNLRTARDGEISPFGEGVEIENLSETELEEVLKGAGDYTTVDLIGNGEATGEVRYEVKEDKVLFSVTAALAEATDSAYQVWLQPVDGNGYKKAFVLDYGKVGYFGSASVSSEALPFNVVISKEFNTVDSEVEEVLLEGMISKE